MSCPVDFSKIKRVLVAKLRHHGDVLLSSPVFSVLKGRFPHLKIDAYVYKETAPMLAGNPGLSEFILYEKEWRDRPFYERIFQEMKVLRRIRKGKYDLVINLTEGDRGAIAARVSKAPYAVGFDPQGGGMKGKSGCYTHLIKQTPKPRHAVEKNLDALRCLGLFPDPGERDLFFHIPKEVMETVSFLLPEKFALFHPVSRWMFKTIPPETMVAAISFLQKRGMKVVLTASGDPIEREMNRKIADRAPGVIDLSGKISIKEWGAVIAKSQFLVTVDSASLHLASALKKPTLAFFGPTCEQNWGPYRNPLARVITLPFSCRPCYQPGCGGSGKSDCLETLSSSTIIEALAPFLKQ